MVKKEKNPVRATAEKRIAAYNKSVSKGDQR